MPTSPSASNDRSYVDALLSVCKGVPLSLLPGVIRAGFPCDPPGRAEITLTRPDLGERVRVEDDEIGDLSTLNRAWGLQLPRCSAPAQLTTGFIANLQAGVDWSRQPAAAPKLQLL
jgi:hypothetical protein